MKPQLLDRPESRKIGRCHDALDAVFFNHEKIVGPGVGVTSEVLVSGIIPNLVGLHLRRWPHPGCGLGADVEWDGLRHG